MQSDCPGRPAAFHDAFARQRRRLALLIVTALAAAVVAGCGSSSSSSSSSSSGGSGGSSASTSASSNNTGLTHAQAVVTKLKAPVSSYALPTAPIKGVASLKGKTVMFIPLINAIPAFQIVESSFADALGKLGIKVQPCNGGANPSTTAACINQAVSQKMAGIVTDAIPYGLAAQAFASAAKSGVKIVIADQIAQPGTTSKNLSYQQGNIDQPTLMADWMIADSGGKANAIVSEETDSPSAKAYVTQGLSPEFAKYCPGCKVKIITNAAGSPDQIASAINSAVISDPNAQYMYTEFEDDLQGTLQGLQQAGKINSIKVLAATATIAGLQKMKAHQAVYSEVGTDVNYEGWADADQLLRMMAGQPVVAEHVPERIFDRSNVGTLTLTPAAQASGEWYGSPSAFKTGFTKLWGVG